MNGFPTTQKRQIGYLVPLPLSQFNRRRNRPTIRMLEVEASSLFDPRPISYHDKHLSEGLETIQAIPRVFSNVQEARLYVDLTRRRIRHFICSLRPGKVGRSDQRPEFESVDFRPSFDSLEPFAELSECTKREQEQ